MGFHYLRSEERTFSLEIWNSMSKVFNPKHFLMEAIHDASYHGTSGSAYLDDCNMGEELTYLHDLLTVEDPNSNNTKGLYE